jgi:hypothetical protein
VKANEQHHPRYQSQRGVRSFILDLNEEVRKNLEKKAKAEDDPKVAVGRLLRRLRNGAVPTVRIRKSAP